MKIKIRIVTGIFEEIGNLKEIRIYIFKNSETYSTNLCELKLEGYNEQKKLTPRIIKNIIIDTITEKEASWFFSLSLPFNTSFKLKETVIYEYEYEVNDDFIDNEYLQKLPYKKL